MVLINSDASVKAFKGEGRPVLNQQERAQILRALRTVDRVLVFEDDKPLQLLAQLQPDVHVKGGSFLPERILEEQQLLQSWGGEFRTFPLVGNLSSTYFMHNVVSRTERSKPLEEAKP